MRGGKSGSRSRAVQRDGSAVAALSFGFVLFVRSGVRLASAPARGSARVTVRRQPHRQRSRRLVYKPSARLTAILIIAALLLPKKLDRKIDRDNNRSGRTKETSLILLQIGSKSAKI